MTERRASERYAVWVPVQFGLGERPPELAVSYDISDSGIRISVAKPLEVGSEITVTFKMMPDDTVERTARGRIVRVDRNTDDPYGLWPYRMAVAFEHPLPELESALKRAIEDRDQA